MSNVNILAAYALLVPQPSSPVMALSQGLLVGAGVVAASFGINYQFANRPAILWLIDGGYHSVQSRSTACSRAFGVSCRRSTRG